MKRIMIDFETFGVGKHACVVQIGAADFDKNETFKCNVDGVDAQRNGAVIDAATVYWWLEQNDAAQKSIGIYDAVKERDAFSRLNDFLKDADEIWSHATFDFVILMEALRRLDIKPSFSYRSARDIRTLLALTGFDHRKVERHGVHHDALHDCLHQIKYCKLAMEKLNRS